MRKNSPNINDHISDILVVSYITDKRHRGKIVYGFKCIKCNYEFEDIIDQAKKRKMCRNKDCRYKKIYNVRKQQDLFGKRFGRITIIEPTEYRQSGGVLWKCKCDCGNEKLILPKYLKMGIVVSCGCYGTEARKNSIAARMELLSENAVRNSAFNRLLLTYKNSAINRNYDFDIPEEQFIKLITGNCYYCNSEPKQTMKKNRFTFRYNGIDRMNNNIGYTIDNCVSCCWLCNRTKNKLDHDEFIDLIEKIHNNMILRRLDA